MISHYAGNAGLSLVHAVRLHRLAARYAAGKGAILRLRHVRPWRGGEFAPHAHMEITPQFLTATVERIRDEGIDIVSMDEALARLADPGARRFCVLTFDGAYRDFQEYAAPELKRLAAPFTLYVTSGFVDRTAEPWWLVIERVIERQPVVAFALDGPLTYFTCRTFIGRRRAYARIAAALSEVDETRQREAARELAWRYGVDVKALLDEELMGWPDIAGLAAEPLATIGSASVHHFALARLPAAQAKAEMRDGARVIEAALGKRPLHLAYPYGSADTAGTREFELAAELGFASGVTSRRAPLRAGTPPLALPRLTINGRHQSLAYLDLMLAGVPHGLKRRG